MYTTCTLCVYAPRYTCTLCIYTYTCIHTCTCTYMNNNVMYIHVYITPFVCVEYRGLELGLYGRELSLLIFGGNSR